MNAKNENQDQRFYKEGADFTVLYEMTPVHVYTDARRFLYRLQSSLLQ